MIFLNLLYRFIILIFNACKAPELFIFVYMCTMFIAIESAPANPLHWSHSSKENGVNFAIMKQTDLSLLDVPGKIVQEKG